MNENQARMQRDIVTVRMDDVIQDYQGDRITIGVSSIIGTRNNQQDSVYTQCESDMALAVVCDGMGGMEGGELASKLAVQILAEDFALLSENSIPDFFRREAVRMDEAVHSLKNEEGKPMNAGTTVVSTIIKNGKLYWLSVGDSRIYIIRGNEFVQVNQDHNYKLRLDNLLKAKDISEEEYLARIGKGEALISYIGIGNVSLMDINPIPFELQDGDVILLCSDGLYKRLSNEEIMEIVQQELPDVDGAASELTRIVMDKTVGSQDNTSLILIQYNQYSNI